MIEVPDVFACFVHAVTKYLENAILQNKHGLSRGILNAR